MAEDNETAPSTNGDNGPPEARDDRGRFLPGNPGGPGNPKAAAVARWRRSLYESVTESDIEAIVNVLKEKAKAGEPWAIRELLDRCLGRPKPAEEDPQVFDEPPEEVSMVFLRTERVTLPFPPGLGYDG